MHPKKQVDQARTPDGWSESGTSRSCDDPSGRGDTNRGQVRGAILDQSTTRETWKPARTESKMTTDRWPRREDDDDDNDSADDDEGSLGVDRRGGRSEEEDGDDESSFRLSGLLLVSCTSTYTPPNNTNNPVGYRIRLVHDCRCASVS